MDFGGPEGSYFSASPLFWFCCFIGCLLCGWASYHVPGTPTNPGYSFSKILPIQCGPSAVHWLDTRMAWNLAHLERTSCTFCSRRGDWELVANVFWYWKLASHVVQRPTHHWIRGVLHWQPVGQRRLRCPKLCWEIKLEMYCRYEGLVHWELAAQNCELWGQHFNTFVDFCCQWACSVCKV